MTPPIARSEAAPPSTADGVAAFYREKTAAILAKYGPGPRVHYHTGLPAPADLAALEGGSAEVLAAAMHTAQERLVAHLDARSPTPLRGRVLDVGCGLGGAALHWAAAGAEVVAITNEPSHVPITLELACRASVADRVVVRAHDAHERLGIGGFEHAVAIESSCYLRRGPWLRALATSLAPGARLHVVDCFDGGVGTWFDEHWRTRLGRLEEYVAALDAAGFVEVEVEDLAPRAAPFWDLSLAWIEARGGDPPSRRRHQRLRDALVRGEVRYLRLAARFPG